MLDYQEAPINIKRVSLAEVPPRLNQAIDPERDITEDQWQRRLNSIKENIAEALRFTDLQNDTVIDYQVVLARALADVACVSPERFKTLGVPGELLDILFQTASAFQKGINTGQLYRFLESLAWIDPQRCNKLFTTWASTSVLENYATKTSGQITFDRARFMLMLKQVSPHHPTVLKKDVLIDQSLDASAERLNKIPIEDIDNSAALNGLRKIALYRLASSQGSKPQLNQRLVEKVRELLRAMPSCHLELLKYAMIATADKIEFGPEGIKMLNTSHKEVENPPMPVIKSI